ncbi:MAG: regulator [Candidatus Epulonipiscioides saccharophilum]|nr:MAG: regulator [Epulopiscium sp. AS2M-Bin001]
MMTIYTDKAPAAIGPYSQAIAYQNLIFTSGQIPLDPSSGQIISGGITEQTEQVIKNLNEVLTAGGSSLKNVLKCTCFLHDMDDFAAFNEVYTKYFVNKPARSCVAVKTLPRNVLVEVECIAFK